MNPFSGFLQPQNNRPLEGLASTQDLLRVIQGNKEMAQRKLENEQQNARGNAYLKLQQDDQSHRWSAEEQKQVESLLAEYHEAEDQDDPIRLSRAAQKLKRFGMDVSQGGVGGAPPANLQDFNGAKPSLKALTGEQLLPPVKPGPAQLQALTGQPPNPIDAAVQQEMESRKALATKAAAPEQDLSQEDFEQQLIDGSGKLPERMENGGETTPEMKAMLPQAPDEDDGRLASPGYQKIPNRMVPVSESDVESFRQRMPGRNTGPMTEAEIESFRDRGPASLRGPVLMSQSDITDPGTPSAGSVAADFDADSPDMEPVQKPRRLATQLLPTVVSKNGKQLYESTGPSGRWAPMVSGVFEPFLQHENPEIASAAKRAQAMASKLIEVDGVAPKDAIKLGMDYLNGEATRTVNLERTKLGSRPRGGGGGGATTGGGLVTGREASARAALSDDMDATVRLFSSNEKLSNLNESDRLLGAAENSLNSDNVASQWDAINQVVAARSGKTVSDRERNLYKNLAGLASNLKNQWKQIAGTPMEESYKRQIRQVIAEIRALNQQEREQIGAAAYDYHKRKIRGRVPDAQADEDAQAVRGAITGQFDAKAVDPNADLDR